MGRARGTWGSVVMVTALAALAATACSPAGSGGGGGGSGKGDGEFVVARTSDLDMLDPHRATAFQTVQTLGVVYGNLLQVDKQGRPQPDLATDWSVSDGGRTVTFDLREDVTFHDGQTFTSADAKASLERLLDEKTAAVAASNLTAVRGIETPDEGTLVLRLSEPDSALPYALASVNTAMLDREDVEAGRVGKKLNGTGPFRYVRWKQNQQAELAAFDGYWDGRPEVSTLVFRVIPDESSILSGMRSGAFDLATISDPSVASQLGSGEDVVVRKQPALAYHALMLNGRRPPLDDLAVRQAIACAVDRQQLVDTAASGDGVVTGPITSPAFEYDPTEGLPCSPPDLGKARELLRGAGYGPDKPVTLRTIVMTGEYATASAEGQNFQAQLEKVGVRLELEQEQSSTYVERWLAAEFDAAVALNGGSYSPYLMYGRYFTEGGSLAKPAGLASAKLDALLTKGNRLQDVAGQRSTYQALQAELLRLSPWVWTFRGTDYYLLSPDVTGFVPMPDQSLDSLARVRVG